MKCSIMLQEKKEQEEREQREWKIQRTLANLGDRSSGSTSDDTAQYSMAFLFLSSAAMGESNISNYDGMNAEEIKRNIFSRIIE